MDKSIPETYLEVIAICWTELMVVKGNVNWKEEALVTFKESFNKVVKTKAMKSSFKVNG